VKVVLSGTGGNSGVDAPPRQQAERAQDVAKGLIVGDIRKCCERQSPAFGGLLHVLGCYAPISHPGRRIVSMHVSAGYQ
jgi:hypothetical protein